MVIDHVHKIKMKITGGMVAGESLTQVILGDTAKSGKGFKGCVKGIAGFLVVRLFLLFPTFF
jgi:hypothetical protein